MCDTNCDNNAARDTLKAELRQHIAALGIQQALLPSTHPAIDTQLQQLEALNPITHPLQPDSLPMLAGNWQLIYASRGTVVTRQLASSPEWWQAIAIEHIWQQLTVIDHHQIAAENGAALTIPWLGSWRLSAQGEWDWREAAQTAIVRFHAFSLQAIHVLGQPHWQLPPLTIPVIEAWRNEAVWITSYLDADLRIGRGATGNRFVFSRSGSVPAAPN